MVIHLGGSLPVEDSVADMGAQLADDALIHRPEDDGTAADKATADQDEITHVEKGIGKLLVKDAQSRYLSEGFWIGVDQVGIHLLVMKLFLANVY